MAKNGERRRIEPTFDGPARKAQAGGLSVGEEDRVVPSARKPSAKKKRAAAGRASAKSRRKARGGLLSLATRLVYWCFVLMVWGGIAAAGVVAYYGARMPSIADWAVPDRPPNVKIVAVDGKLIANRGMTGGEAVGLHEMSPYIPEAVIAIEDRRFYSHFGVDPIGLTRAVLSNAVSGHVSQGGSTLTQQLA